MLHSNSPHPLQAPRAPETPPSSGGPPTAPRGARGLGSRLQARLRDRGAQLTHGLLGRFQCLPSCWLRDRALCCPWARRLAQCRFLTGPPRGRRWTPSERAGEGQDGSRVFLSPHLGSDSRHFALPFSQMRRCPLSGSARTCRVPVLSRGTAVDSRATSPAQFDHQGWMELLSFY